jgi:demethylmenaquinone methyltransferase / 2-methoxy-6-polyprenyl-1,4-benzoquinol methylase
MTTAVTKSRAEPTTFSRSLFRGLPRHYDRLAFVLSFGQDACWRRAMVAHARCHDAARILDVATGPGSVVRVLATAAPNSQIVGLDVSPDMLARGARNAQDAGLDHRVALVLGRGESLPFPDDSFDVLTFTYLLRYVEDPQRTLDEIARVVKPGGHVANLEFARPDGVVARPAWWFYTRVVLPVAGFVLGGPSWWHVGRFLGPSISAHAEQFGDEWSRLAWTRAGLVNVDLTRMSWGGGVVTWGTKAP